MNRLTEKVDFNPEGPRRYVYRSYRHDRAVVFECEAANIIEADERYEAKFGRHPKHEKNIGCTIELID